LICRSDSTTGSTESRGSRGGSAAQGISNFLEKRSCLETTASGVGKEKFVQKLDLELDTGRSADEVMADAEAEFAACERDMYVIAAPALGPVLYEATAAHR